MKFKYRKAFLLVLLSTMGMGILTLSFSPESNKRQEDTPGAATGNSGSTKNSSENSRAGMTPTPTISAALTQTPTPTQASTLTSAPTPIPTPTPYPVYPLEDKGYPEVDALIKDYYDAKFNCNVEKFKKIFSDPSDAPSTDQLKMDIMYVEEYKNIKCYVKKSFEDGAFIVYVYNDIKYLNIKTPAPAVDRFYIITDSTGNLKIFSGKLDEERQKYYDDRLGDDDVKKLIDDTNKKGEKAKKSDELLKTFWDGLDEKQKSSSEEKSGN